MWLRQKKRSSPALGRAHTGARGSGGWGDPARLPRLHGKSPKHTFHHLNSYSKLCLSHFPVRLKQKRGLIQRGHLPDLKHKVPVRCRRVGGHREGGSWREMWVQGLRGKGPGGGSRRTTQGGRKGAALLGVRLTPEGQRESAGNNGLLSSSSKFWFSSPT